MNVLFKNCMSAVHALNMPMNIFEEHSTMNISVFLMEFGICRKYEKKLLSPTSFFKMEK